MRPLKHHLILYDADCPMCNLYTGAFTKSGMLDPDGRAPYQSILDPKNQAPAPPGCPNLGNIDRDRAVNEIALIDTTTGEISYGIDSLFAIIGHSFSFFRPLFSWRPFRWTMRKLYAFISYNRKIIIPAPANATCSLKPAFSLRHRIAWLIFATVTAAAILTHYAKLLAGVLPVGGPLREYLVCSGQLFYQGMVISLIAPAKRWDYLGHMTTISLAGSLALLPVLGLAALTRITPYAATAWFLLIVALMLAEHLRRTRLLGLDATLTVSWVAYRLMVLLLIIY